jgi:hypothetical protein
MLVAVFIVNVVGDHTYLGIVEWLPAYSYAQYDVTGSLLVNSWFSAALGVTASTCFVYLNDVVVESFGQQGIPSITDVVGKLN